MKQTPSDERLTKEKILNEISSNYYGADGFINGVNIWLVDPEKLASFLGKHLKRE